MAKGEFTCNLCKRVVKAGDLWGDTDKCVCPTHKALCANCIVSKGFFSKSFECKKCGKKLTIYAYHKEYGKWMKRERP
jgi:hypothetical protein